MVMEALVGKHLKGKELPSPLILISIAIAVASLVFITAFIAFNSFDAIKEIGIWNFVTGSKWSPMSGAYGASSLIVGTILVTFGAVAFSLPMGIGIAIYLNDVASKRQKRFLKPLFEIFAGIPSVVYGFMGLMVMVPLMMDIFPDHLDYGTSWLGGSLILGIMALPTIISVSQDALASVPKTYTEASLALGSTRWESTRIVSLKVASSGLAAAAILGIGRALGETMAVLMVTGNSASVPQPLWDIFDMVRTMTANIALEMPEVGHGSLHFSALFLLALMLFVITVAVNLIARKIVRDTKRKMNGEVVGNRMSRDLLAGRGKALFRIAFMLGTAIPISLISSLFIGDLGVVVGAAYLALLLSSGRISHRISSKNVERAVYSTFGMMALAIVVLLVAIMYVIVSKGLPALSLEFITGTPKSGGLAGGIWPAIVGTLELMVGTAIIAIPLGIGSGIFLAKYAGESRISKVVRHTVDALNGTPSIIFGLFGMSLLVIAFGWGYSLIGGCITLALMILPTIIKTTEESLNALPSDLEEASYALGASKRKTIDKVLVPVALGGIVTGSILGLGRAVGETAPIMLTATVAYKATVGISPFDPVMALPYHLYYLASEVPGSQEQCYGTALVLIVIVCGMFALATYIRERQKRKTGY